MDCNGTRDESGRFGLARLELFSDVLVSLENGTSGAVSEIVERLETPDRGLRRYRVRILDVNYLIDEPELQPLPADRSDRFRCFEPTSGSPEGPFAGANPSSR
jgi:hypothetical protein